MPRLTPIRPAPEENVPRVGQISRALPLLIEFTRTSPTFSRQERIFELQGLIDRCTRAIEICFDDSNEAKDCIYESEKHHARIIQIRMGFTRFDRLKLTIDAMNIKAGSSGEHAALQRNLTALRECKDKAEIALAEARKA
ncbi:hypothetical protein MMC29_000960 [Sticta canariensis]|nr:hypothetical protein [Sticta canariensis]